MKKVMVFGVFDGIHDGHRNLFRQAKKYGKKLVAVVAQDHIVENLKGHLPKLNLGERIDVLRAEKNIDEVAVGDAELGSYEVLLKHRPDVIALGYDQKEFKKDINANSRRFDWKPKILILKPYKPDKYHSSLL